MVIVFSAIIPLGERKFIIPVVYTSWTLFLVIILSLQDSWKIPQEAPLTSHPVIIKLEFEPAKIPAVLYSLVFSLTLVVSYLGYCALIFKLLTATLVVFTTYNTALYAIAYPPSLVGFLTFSATLFKYCVSLLKLIPVHPTKVALLPIILIFLSM